MQVYSPPSINKCLRRIIIYNGQASSVTNESEKKTEQDSVLEQDRMKKADLA